MMKKGPLPAGLSARYCKIAITGQMGPDVRPRYKVAPAPNWSVLDDLRVIANVVGLEWLSTATSASDRCFLLS